MDMADPERPHLRNKDYENNRKGDKDVNMRETLIEGFRHSLRQNARGRDRMQDEDSLRDAGSEQGSSILRSRNQADRK